MLENKQYSQWIAEINRMLEYKHIQTMNKLKRMLEYNLIVNYVCISEMQCSFVITCWCCNGLVK
jgi:hypothetical protein